MTSSFRVGLKIWHELLKKGTVKPKIKHCVLEEIVMTGVTNVHRNGVVLTIIFMVSGHC